jgi:hypothetical protein
MNPAAVYTDEPEGKPEQHVQHEQTRDEYANYADRQRRVKR